MELIAGALIALLGALVGAWTSHTLERSARREERASAQVSREGQISADAYALRRQLHSWLRDSRAESDTQEWAKRISRGFDAAEQRVSRIAATAGDISSDKAAAARRAFVLFYEATAVLNGAAEGDFLVWQRKDNTQEFVRPAAMDLVREARGKLERCVGELERAIDRALLEAEEHHDPDYRE